MSISAGVYTVGPGGEYATLKAARDDLASNLTGDLTLVVIGPTTEAASIAMFPNLQGYKLTIKGLTEHRGHPESAPLITVDHGSNFLELIVSSSVAGAEIEVKDLRVERDAGASPGATNALFRMRPAAGENAITAKIHDILIDGNDKDGYGVEIWTDHTVQAWNIKGTGCNHGLVAVTKEDAAADDTRVENCTAYDCLVGFRHLLEGKKGRFNNNVAVACGTDFSIVSGLLGDGNASEDATAADFNGDNLSSQGDLTPEFESLLLTGMWLRLAAAATILPTGGVAPTITDNTAGAESNARPGLDALYSRGADEARAAFPNGWSRRARVLVDPTFVDSAQTAPLLLPSDAPGLPALFKTLTKAYGEDIRITSDAEGTDLLPIEIFRYGADDDEYSMWVKHLWDADDQTPIYVWWGNDHAAQLPRAATGSFLGSELVWEDYGLVYHMGNRDDSLKWTEDSGPNQGHMGIPSAVGLAAWTDNANGEGKLADATWGLYMLVPDHASDLVLRNIPAFAMTAILDLDAGAHDDTILDAQGPASSRALFQTRSQLSALDAYAPDGTGPDVVTGDTLIDTALHLVSMRCSIANDRMVAYLDGAVDDDEAVAFTPGLLDNTAADIGIGMELAASDAFRGNLGEVRVYEAESTDARFKLIHENLKAASALFIGPYTGGDCMPGLRSFKFTVPGSGPFELDNTDFWLSYDNSGSGALTLKLNGVWDKVCPATLYGLARRQELEALIQELSEWFVGLKGALVIDEGHAGEVSLASVKLTTANWSEISSNAGLIYTLEFALNEGIASGAEVSRLLVFGSKALAADNFLVEYVGRDQTQFKEVFRAAPVRIPGGPAIKGVLVQAIVEGLAPGTLLQRRQQAEAVIKDWIDTYLGTEANLTIDGLGLGTAHLSSIRPGVLNLPDAVGYDLEFAIAYGS